MSDGTVTLKEREDWLRLRPLEDGHAEVLDGTVFAAGDLVAGPQWLTWLESGEEGRDGDTLVSPFQLELYYDSVTGWFHLDECGDLHAIRTKEDPVAQGIVELVDRVIDDGNDMARRIIAAIHEPIRDSGRRRRRSDLAA